MKSNDVVRKVTATDWIFGEDRFGWWAGVSGSNFVLCADSELILTTLQQFRHPVLHLWMDFLCVAADPPGSRNITS